MSEIKKEKLFKEEIIQVSMEGIKKILFQMENCICKIYQNDSIQIGFFCKIPYIHNSLLPVLITNNLKLKENDKSITLSINNKVKKIKIDNSRKTYIDPFYNISIIEIKPNKDKIYNYLELDENYFEKIKDNIILDNKNKPIYIIHFSKEKLYTSYEVINNIIDNKIINDGSPILSLDTFKIVGIFYNSSHNYNKRYDTFIKYIIDEFNGFKNEINIIYKTDVEDYKNIFGDKFVENNKNNIELIINGTKNEFICKYKLRKGENNIKIIIKNKITNLECMFYECKSLKNIKELEYLDTNYVNNFSYMFYGCSSLSDIKGLQNWNVSNGYNFSHLFYGCSSLSDIKGLQNWDISNAKIFQSMFYGCSSLSDIKVLENWNVSNGNNFSYMFWGCSSLSDIKALKNWNVSNGYNFSYMFSWCSSLSNKKD